MTHINSRTLLLIQNSEWFEPNALDFLALPECQYPYEIYEKIWLNVASKYGILWKELYYAKDSNSEIYAELCVTLLLIEDCLKIYFQYTQDDVDIILGAKFSQIVYNCHNYLGKII